MATEVVNRQRRIRIDRKRIVQLANRTLEAAGRSGASITVAFIRDSLMHSLNREYRDKDRPTDVLSFPAGEQPKAATGERGEPSTRGYDSFLGDVVISADAVMSQAIESHWPVEREVDELVIHGVLHLCGYDHETDGGEMNRLELKLRRKLLGKA